jgi:FtsP/CotA-like multicopper oxidase with cupredoxin domain
MAEQDQDKLQEQNEAAIDKTTSRRDFFARAMAATSAITLAEFLPNSLVEAQTPACNPTPCFANPGEIKSTGGKLRGIITINNEVRTVQNVPKRVRFFAGYNPADPKPWPNTKGLPAPGPTLRGKVGDTVNITLLNHINVADFRESVNAGPGMGTDRAEKGLGCDASTAVIDGVTDKNWYPKADHFADCFHGSNTGNLHFHGTHTNPDGLGDNVLIQVLPSPRDAKGNPVVNENSVGRLFERIFANCPTKYDQLPKPWRDEQADLLNKYDHSQEWEGQRGLPPEMRLLPKNEELIKRGLWPQFYIGAYPHCFPLPAYEGEGPGKPTMGQAPGTHWYHAHKHGSTALHLLNGLAGAFIIEGKYDEDLRKIYPNFDGAQKVLVLQEFDDTPNLIRAGLGARPLLVNGLLTPTITMQPGEVQLWRFVNAAQSLGGGKPLAIQFGVPTSGTAPIAMQIAQDGVQYKWENFEPQLKTPMQSFPFATGNRMDLLVQAPSTPGNFTLLSKPPSSVLANVQVTGTAITPAQKFPDKSNYPEFPHFLHDIDPPSVHITRTMTFGWEKGRTGPGRNANPGPLLNSGPIWNIDGKQFEDGTIDQLMLLNSAEDWIIYNYSTVNHTFHIHVNPFQVIQIHDPNQNPPDTYAPTKDFIWQDTIALPSALVANGKMVLDPNTGLAQTPGYVKIRQHFVDFPGTFVLHCHILGHEDRGMMQLVQVQDNHTPFKHH